VTMTLKTDTDTAAFQAGTLSVTGGISHGGTILMSGTTTLTDGAGANAGTLGTAPTAGDPAKWIGYDDNGTTLWIPAWT